MAMQDPRSMGLFDLIRAKYSQPLTRAYEQKMAAAQLAPAVESYMAGQQPNATPDQLQRFEDKMMKQNLSEEMYASYKGESDAELDDKSKAYMEQFYAAAAQDQPQQVAPGGSLPEAKFLDKAGLMSDFIEASPRLDPSTRQMVAGLMGTGDTLDPAAVKEHKYFLSLPDDAAREQFLRVKRAQQILDLKNRFVGVSGLDPSKTTPIADIDIAPEQQPAFLAKKKQTMLKAQAQAEAQLKLGKAQITYEKNKKLTTSMLAHPGLESAFGKSSYIPAVKGSDRANFEAQLNQLKNTVFIANRDALKGGGSITDYEGDKAEESELRATNAQSAEEFKEAMKDYNYWVDRGYNLLQKQAKGDFSLSKKKPPSTQSLVDKYAD